MINYVLMLLIYGGDLTTRVNNTRTIVFQYDNCLTILSTSLLQ